MHQDLEDERKRANDDISEEPSTSDQGLGASTHPPPPKQAKLIVGQSVSQSKVSQLIAEFVIDTVQPFSLVEEPSFKRLIEGISLGKKNYATMQGLN